VKQNVNLSEMFCCSSDVLLPGITTLNHIRLNLLLVSKSTATFLLSLCLQPVPKRSVLLLLFC